MAPLLLQDEAPTSSTDGEALIAIGAPREHGLQDLTESLLIPTSLVAQAVKNLPVIRENHVRSLG